MCVSIPAGGQPYYLHLQAELMAGLFSGQNSGVHFIRSEQGGAGHLFRLIHFEQPEQ